VQVPGLLSEILQGVPAGSMADESLQGSTGGGFASLLGKFTSEFAQDAEPRVPGTSTATEAGESGVDQFLDPAFGLYQLVPPPGVFPNLQAEIAGADADGAVFAGLGGSLSEAGLGGPFGHVLPGPGRAVPGVLSPAPMPAGSGFAGNGELPGGAAGSGMGASEPMPASQIAEAPAVAAGHAVTEAPSVLPVVAQTAPVTASNAAPAWSQASAVQVGVADAADNVPLVAAVASAAGRGELAVHAAVASDAVRFEASSVPQPGAKAPVIPEGGPSAVSQSAAVESQALAAVGNGLAGQGGEADGSSQPLVNASGLLGATPGATIVAESMPQVQQSEAAKVQSAAVAMAMPKPAGRPITAEGVPASARAQGEPAETVKVVPQGAEPQGVTPAAADRQIVPQVLNADAPSVEGAALAAALAKPVKGPADSASSAMRPAVSSGMGEAEGPSVSTASSFNGTSSATGEVGQKIFAGMKSAEGTDGAKAAGSSAAGQASSQTAGQVSGQGGVQLTAAAGMMAAAAQQIAGEPVEGGGPDTLQGFDIRAMARTDPSFTGRVEGAQTPAQAQSAQVATQVVGEIARHLQNGQTRFQMRFDPPELGRVDVNMRVASDGSVQAHLIVERPETLDMFLRDQRGLERALEAAGLNTDADGLQFSLKDEGGREFAFGEDGDQQQNESGAGGENSDDQTDVAALEQAARLYQVTGSSGLDIRI